MKHSSLHSWIHPVHHVRHNWGYMLGIGTSSMLPIHKNREAIFFCTFCFLPIMFIRGIKNVFRLRETN